MAEAAQMEIKRINTETLIVPIVGTAPLLVHKFSEKAKRQMLDNMQGRKSPKQPKDPDAEYLASMYRLDDDQEIGHGFPVISFKAATVSSARLYDKSVSMTALRQFVFFDAEFSKAEGRRMVRIVGEPQMREDVTRVGVSGTDLRYRAEFPEWSTTLQVVYIKSMLTQDSVLSLIDAGGMAVGVGEWRPEKNGDFGTYQIDETREVIASPAR